MVAAWRFDVLNIRTDPLPTLADMRQLTAGRPCTARRAVMDPSRPHVKVARHVPNTRSSGLYDTSRAARLWGAGQREDISFIRL